ncbi:MAG: anhydro-N-acetylmuramic acid kinase [Ferruginibacter sp.]
MNPNIKKLYSIAGKKKRRIIGLMSGTSLDGLDIALCTTEGSGKGTKIKLEHFETKPYNDHFRRQVKKVFAKKNIDFEHLCLLNEWIATEHAALVNSCLKKWNVPNDQVDLLASHGQTVYHAPKHQHKKEGFGNATLQIGDGDHLAVKTGIITLSDFRQKHIAAGGEGAPLAAYGDYLLFSEDGQDVILLNIGGIANFTWLPAKGRLYSSDTGPGNTLMDAWTRKNFSGYIYDENALIARKGKINETLLETLNGHPFLKMPFPKTTGPEVFSMNFLEEALAKTKTAPSKLFDIMATLNRFTSATICTALKQVIGKKKGVKIYVSGGGIYNPLLMDHIKSELKNCTVLSTSEKNIHPDAKEAVLFALLANEAVAGNPEIFETGGSGFPAVSMGKISFPH